MMMSAILPANESGIKMLLIIFVMNFFTDQNIALLRSIYAILLLYTIILNYAHEFSYPPGDIREIIVNEDSS